MLPPRAQNKTVLLVEDDVLMRSMTKQMLEDHGYTVLGTEDGDSALERLRENGSVDLALTDVVMRGMSGPDLAVHLAKSYPTIRVIYMSGYTGELLNQTEGMKLGIPLLEKPFTRAKLLNALHSAVGQKTY
jgi:two-component system cell cycle sensor histidine kinase/response regulator CckA